MFLKDCSSCLGSCEEAPAGSRPAGVERGQVGAERERVSDALSILKVQPTEGRVNGSRVERGIRHERCRFSDLNNGVGGRGTI